MSKKKQKNANIENCKALEQWEYDTLNVDSLEFEKTSIIIDGVEYELSDYTPKLYRQIKDLDEPAMGGDLDAKAKQVNLLVGISLEDLENIPHCKLQCILEYCVNRIANIKKKSQKSN